MKGDARLATVLERAVWSQVRVPSEGYYEIWSRATDQRGTAQPHIAAGVTMPFIIGADPNSPLEGLEPVPSALAEQPKAVTYWYIHK